ncbi:MAG TPA: ParB/RepB/Spo0J family partition protein [Anaerolineae bacterium]
MPSAKHGLGRGLGALIPTTLLKTPTDGGTREVELARIDPNPRQPRTRIDAAALAELAESIREHGLIQPLIVTPAPDSTEASPHYQLITGERRWRASKLAGLTRVPAVIRGATTQEMLEIALVENIQRADLNILEEAQAYKQLMEDFGLTQEQIAGKVAKDRVTVSNALRLLKLPEPLKTAVADNVISQGHARALFQLPDEKKQRALLQVVISKALSVRQTEELVRRLLEGDRLKKKKRTAEIPHETRALEEGLRHALGTKVSLSRSRKGGKVVIEFYSDEELEAIYQKIVRSG